ncbi:MAG: hypothetical protein A2900_03105 [Candidatus Chisholmbacteria bacterium RIFCSPLOWO2_01_FULL_50_28]|uniref:Membrane protein 6-pyruvoyl-tetrahydropterin synthase-related domain-containing protein n=1 Tax=Candidatus Chisholmbacteria bacterium RIFCSPHIGHO2_01_FULL_52_32 TaxID=1797591 RepID=A0A1G1VT33_9BACT|nr:MAG: hypothetical protein A2786_03640 [Candidatus Chisholmbacteria bacterium RIFCSPHIGHO2_01_FULL_52_32]OGY20064.1 MAG: hypothetical protein A2900_03105 [Candidatus Chisholmbacteria bacterium RIFCSPLOWO2_01_FULL_50_28]
MRRILPFFMLCAFTFLLFWKTVVYGLVPAPFDLLVSWFFPYNLGGWQIDGRMTTYKGGWFASDAVREIYPWRELAFDLVRQGQLPLWNPYAFSGTPLLANFQTAVFYPINLLFAVVGDFAWGWAMYVISAVILGSVFMYLFLRSLKLSRLAATAGGIAFVASGLMISWLEWGVVAHAAIWLPLMLFAINRFRETGKKRFLFLLMFSILATIFAGYPQKAAYVFLISITWFLFLFKSTERSVRKSFAFPILFTLLIAIGVSAIQWVPTMELYFHSAMRGEVSNRLSLGSALSPAHLAAIFVPDYFGNRTTENYWGKDLSDVDYMDVDLYAGAILMFLVVNTLLERKGRKEKQWLVWLVFVGLLLGVKSPIVSLITKVGIPVFGTGAAAKSLFITMFATCCLGAMGLDRIREEKHFTKLRLAIIIVVVIYLGLFASTFLIDPVKASIARQGFIVPLGSLGIGIGALLLIRRFRINTTFTGLIFLALLSIELLIHAEKILPFASPKFAFPKHILIEELKGKAGYDRVDGFWDSEIATNFHTAFRLYSAEGYDPLYIRRYGEFMTAAETGQLPPLIPRSDADITQKNETNRNRLIDLTSVKFIAAKVTDPNQPWEEEPLKYDPARFKLLWQQGKFKIYENLHALPRVSLVYDWKIIPQGKTMIKTIYDSQFNPHETILLEEDPAIEKQVGIAKGEAQIRRYEPNFVEVMTQSEAPSLLLLTDSYYPGWRATVDGIPTQILRANYTFRAVALPADSHKVTFTYYPLSLLVGKSLSIISLLLLAGGLVYGSRMPEKASAEVKFDAKHSARTSLRPKKKDRWTKVMSESRI